MAGTAGEHKLPPGFPRGLRVLVVDDDSLCLKVLEQMLRKCDYKATTCTNGSSALHLLRERPTDFDLVLSDVYMPDMDGFKLLEMVGLEMDLPVIMMSSNGETSTVLRGVTHGAVDFLIKPVRIEELRNVWQHVIRRRRDLVKELDSDEHSQENHKEDHPEPGRKRKETSSAEAEHHEEVNACKKPRVTWSVEMHQKFVAAVNQLGVDKAVPKKILDIMNVEGLTRENVASHLQKYRLYLKRVQGAPSQGHGAHHGHGHRGGHSKGSSMAVHTTPPPVITQPTNGAFANGHHTAASGRSSPQRPTSPQGAAGVAAPLEGGQVPQGMVGVTQGSTNAGGTDTFSQPFPGPSGMGLSSPMGMGGNAAMNPLLNMPMNPMGMGPMGMGMPPLPSPLGMPGMGPMGMPGMPGMPGMNPLNPLNFMPGMGMPPLGMPNPMMNPSLGMMNPNMGMGMGAMGGMGAMPGQQPTQQPGSAQGPGMSNFQGASTPYIPSSSSPLPGAPPAAMSRGGSVAAPLPAAANGAAGHAGDAGSVKLETDITDPLEMGDLAGPLGELMPGGGDMAALLNMDMEGLPDLDSGTGGLGGLESKEQGFEELYDLMLKS